MNKYVAATIDKINQRRRSLFVPIRPAIIGRTANQMGETLKNPPVKIDQENSWINPAKIVIFSARDKEPKK